MNKPARFLLAAAAALLVPGCGSAPEEPPLAGARIGGPFALTDQDGRQVTDAQFAGRYRLIYFGYTFCPDVCPTTLQHLMRGFEAFAKADPARAAKVQPIFITVDPARDTPAVMKQYVGAFDPRLIGLTGSEAQIAAVAKAFAVSYQKVASEGASDYLMNHASIPLLFGPKGEPIAVLPADDDKAIAAELDKWVK